MLAPELPAPFSHEASWDTYINRPRMINPGIPATQDKSHCDRHCNINNTAHTMLLHCVIHYFNNYLLKAP